MSGATTLEENLHNLPFRETTLDGNPHNLPFKSLVARYLVKKAVVRCMTNFPPGAPLVLPPNEGPEYNPIPDRYSKGPALEDLPICIIGAGVAGLRTAMQLDRLGLQYEIIEASDRHGGRVYTYHFEGKENHDPEKPEDCKFHDYYDVGAMRFPRIKVMDPVFKLFKDLDLDRDGKIIEYIMEAPGNVQLFNGKCSEPGYWYPLKGF